MKTVDHFMYAVPDLEKGIDQFEALTGVRCDIGGPHPGNGTRNALMSLGDEVYFELIAPDPTQDLTGNWGEEFARLTEPRMITFAVQTKAIKDVQAKVAGVGLTCDAPRFMSRNSPDGKTLEWHVMPLGGHDMERQMPFFIDWGETTHPAKTTVKGCTLVDFQMLVTDAPRVRQVFDALGIDVAVSQALTPGFFLKIDTPKGPVSLTGFGYPVRRS